MAAKLETGQVSLSSRTASPIRFAHPLGRKPKTLLIMPPITISEGAVKRVIPPLGLLYIAASLDRAGYSATILDCVAEGVSVEQEIADRTWRVGLTDNDIAKVIARERPDVVGISVLYSSDLPRAFEVAAIIRATASEARIVVGGLHPSIYPEDALHPSAPDGRPLVDFVIRGEGELRLLSLLRSIEVGELDPDSDGLCANLDGRWIINSQRSNIADLDTNAFPLPPAFDMEPYFRHNVPFSPFPRGNRVMQIQTSRGCPIGCTFCASTNFQKAYRARSVANVIDEIRELKRRFAIDELQFADDNLTFDRDRARHLFTELQREDLDWCTPNGVMVATLDHALIDAMVDSGMYQITLSLDGATDRTLRERHRKPLKLTSVPDLVRHLAERQILIHTTLVVGAPGETEDEICEAFEFISSLPFTSVGVFIAQPLPGSELYEVALADGRVTAEEALRIDTARAVGRISDIPPRRLQDLAAQFLYAFNDRARRTQPALWKIKYSARLERLKEMCVGRAAPNTDGIIRAANAGPNS